MSVSPSQPTVSVIIVSYNGRQYLGACLLSVVNQDFEDFEILLVDNASDDSSADFVRENFPSVEVVQNERNLGYAGANNIGIVRSKGEYVVLLNQDTIVDKGWLAELVKTMESSRRIGIAQSRIQLMNEPHLLNTDGNIANLLGFGFPGNLGREYAGIPVDRDISFPSGCSMIIRKDMLEKIGLLDELFFLYSEDLDIGLRARTQRYGIRLSSKSVVYHDYGFSLSSNKIFFLERNRLMTVLKNYEFETILRFSLAFIICELAVLIHCSRSGLLASKLRSYHSFLQLLPTVLYERQKVQTRRTVSDRELMKYLSSDLIYSPMEQTRLSQILGSLLRKLLDAFRPASQKDQSVETKSERSRFEGNQIFPLQEQG